MQIFAEWSIHLFTYLHLSSYLSTYLAIYLSTCLPILNHWIRTFIHGSINGLCIDQKSTQLQEGYYVPFVRLMASPCEEGISKRDLRESMNCYTYATPLCHVGNFSLQDTNPFSSCSIPLSTFRDFIFFSGDWVPFLVLQTERSFHLRVCASGVRLVELAQQKSRVQLAKPKSFENLSPGVGSGWECLEIFYYHSIKVMVLGLVESVRSLLPDFLSLELVQGGTIFLYHSCTKKAPAWGPVLACVVCCRATWKSKWPRHSTSSPKVTVPAFLGEEIGARPLWWWLQCFFFFASHKGNNVGNGQEAARELISNTYLPHCRVFWKGSWPILR